MKYGKTTRDKDGTIRSFVHKELGIISAGGRVGNVGGTIGLDRGKPFGSVNVGGKVVGSFGPQGDDMPRKKKKRLIKRALA